MMLKKTIGGLFERNYALSRMLHGRQKGNHESEQAKTKGHHFKYQFVGSRESNRCELSTIHRASRKSYMSARTLLLFEGGCGHPKSLRGRGAD